MTKNGSEIYMVQIMTIGLSEPQRAKEIVGLFMKKEKPPYPDYLKKIVNGGAGFVNGKYRSIAIYECPDDKLYEAMVALGARYHFYASLGGYTYEIIPITKEADAMKMVFGK